MNNTYMQSTTPNRISIYNKYKDPNEFNYIIGLNVNDIILFDNGTEEFLEQGRVILPRNYKIFVGNKNSELQFKPYEYDQYRIVVTTYDDIIYSVDTIG